MSTAGHPDELERYSRVAILLHWAIALLIILNWPLGHVLEKMPPAQRTPWMSLHVSIGLAVLALTVVRIAWRVRKRPPALDAHLTRLEAGLAHLAHLLLYGLMLFLPLTGWAILSCWPPKPGSGPMVWGLFHLPKWPFLSHMDKAPQVAAHHQFVELHVVGGWVLLAAFLLHVAGALKHQFVDRRPSLSRMGVGRASAR